MKFWRCFVRKIIYFYVNLMNDLSLIFRKYWFIYFMFAGPYVNSFTERLNYSRFRLFLWNIIGFSIFRTLNKKYLQLIIHILKIWCTLMSSAPFFKKEISNISRCSSFGFCYRCFKCRRGNNIQKQGIPLKVYKISVII